MNKTFLPPPPPMRIELQLLFFPGSGGSTSSLSSSFTKIADFFLNYVKITNPILSTRILSFFPPLPGKRSPLSLLRSPSLR